MLEVERVDKIGESSEACEGVGSLFNHVDENDLQIVQHNPYKYKRQRQQP